MTPRSWIVACAGIVTVAAFAVPAASACIPTPDQSIERPLVGRNRAGAWTDLDCSSQGDPDWCRRASVTVNGGDVDFLGLTLTPYLPTDCRAAEGVFQ